MNKLSQERPHPVKRKGTDPLTGCLLYGDFLAALEKHVVPKKRLPDSVAIALIDIDWFGQFNKTEGHDAGDGLIAALGAFLKASAPDATVYRYGGDAFMLLFVGNDKESVFLIAESLRNRFCEQQRNANGSKKQAPLTVSIGVAAHPDDAADVPSLIRKCHEALYRAKVSGRDKVCLAREEKMVTKTSHYTQGQLEGLSRLAKREGLNEAVMLREALDDLLRKYNA